jgi:hypothetical protein
VMWVMANLVLVCLETVLVSVQDRCRFAPNYHRTHPMVLRGDKAQVEARFGPFRDSATLDAR